MRVPAQTMTPAPRPGNRQPVRFQGKPYIFGGPDDNKSTAGRKTIEIASSDITLVEQKLSDLADNVLNGSYSVQTQGRYNIHKEYGFNRGTLVFKPKANDAEIRQITVKIKSFINWKIEVTFEMKDGTTYTHKTKFSGDSARSLNFGLPTGYRRLQQAAERHLNGYSPNDFKDLKL